MAVFISVTMATCEFDEVGPIDLSLFMFIFNFQMAKSLSNTKHTAKNVCLCVIYILNKMFSLIIELINSMV